MKKMNKILISQPLPLNAHNPYADMEEQYGVHFDFEQLIRIQGLSAREFRDQHIYLENYTAILLSSRLSIDHFFHLCEELRFQVPESMHYYCISEAVGNYLQKYIQYRKRKVFAAADNRFESLLPAMNRRPNEKYLMVMSDVHNDDDINMFASHKITVRPAVMYRTVPVEWPADKPFDYDMIVLFTPSGVHALKKNFPTFDFSKTIMAGFGKSTIAAMEEAGWTVTIKTPSPEFPSITAAIENYLQHIGK